MSTKTKKRKQDQPTGTKLTGTIETTGTSTDNQETTKTENVKDKKRQTKKRRNNEGAVLIRPTDGKTYADTLRQIKTAVDPGASKVKVQGLHKTKDGGLLLRLRSKATERQNFQEELRQALRESARVRDMTSGVRLEVMDLDCTTEVKDVTNALERETGQKVDPKVHIFGPNRQELCIAVCELEDSHARKLLQKGRIKIGWVYCRVRRRLAVPRCFKCLGYGHVRADCKETDRRDVCWKCSLAAHVGKDCPSKEAKCFLCASAKTQRGWAFAGLRQMRDLQSGTRGIPKGYKDMTGVLQGNLHRCEAAQLLLPQIATERNADILILSEQYRNLMIPTWLSSASGTAAIWVRDGNKTRILASDASDDYVWVRVGAVTYVSVYLTPNCTAKEFEAKVERLEGAMGNLPGDLIVAGDLNYRAIEWGMTTTDKRGRLLLEMAARLDLIVANLGRTPTYRRPGFGYSIPDVTLASDRIISWIRGWRVLEDFSASDHQHIAFEVVDRTGTTRTVSVRPLRWNLKRQDREKFEGLLFDFPAPSSALTSDLTDRQKTERLVDETMQMVTRLCDASMPRKKDGPRKQATYWWTDEIGQLRKDCIRCKRRLYRARERGKPDAEYLSVEYKIARKTLTRY